MTRVHIAKDFSRGQFENCFPFLSEDAIWHIPGSHRLEGRVAIEAHCRNIRAYFDSVETNFQILQTIETAHTIVVTGTAQFHKNGQLLDFVYACDVYQLNDANQIHTITSYCVSDKAGKFD